MIGFWLVNLMPPETPESFNLKTPAGLWAFQRSASFNTLEMQIQKGWCANTYAMEFPLPTDATRGLVKDAAFGETLPICLAASFVTGAAVTIRDSLPGSEVKLLAVGSHFPRSRGVADPAACVRTMD